MIVASGLCRARDHIVPMQELCTVCLDRDSEVEWDGVGWQVGWVESGMSTVGLTHAKVGVSIWPGEMEVWHIH